MVSELLLRGAVLGLTIAAAVGPISLLCIRRTLADGRLVGFVSGLGAATADGTYAAVAAFGLTVVSDVLLGGTRLLGLVGGAFLVYLGVRTLRARPATLVSASDAAPPTGVIGAYASTVVLTLANPATIISFAGSFAGFGVGDAGRVGAFALVLGVFLGSTAWWAILTTAVARLRSRVTPRALRWVNAVSGALLFMFGAAALASGLVAVAGPA